MALAEIVQRKRQDVEQRLRDKMAFDLKPSDRSLEAALRKPHTGFILECKKASPSQGLIRRDFDPASIARAYAPFADAISVLTDEPFFQGRHEYLRMVRDVVSCPVLCKDFVVHPYQVEEARHYGADAILLMLSVLDDATFIECRKSAEKWNVDVLCEVHDEAELERAIRLDARIIGINNRDLKTLKVDRSVTQRLSSLTLDRIVVSESGIENHAHVREMRSNVHAFLVGTSLMKSPSIEEAVRRLIFGNVKVCGLRRAEDAHHAWDSGATWGGLILAPESKRCVDATLAAQIKRDSHLRWTGVFVNESSSTVADVAQRLELDAVQLHGEETDEYIQTLRSRTTCEIWKACRVENKKGTSPLYQDLYKGDVPFLSLISADRLLLDAFDPQARGGTGKTFDWDIARRHPDRENMLLSGGLSPENAREADAVGTWGLDVNSGVEDAPGEKSREKMQKFLEELRG